MKTVIEIDNLTEPQRIALEDLLAVWVNLGRMGASRWTSFYADGDGNFHPRITIDGRAPAPTPLVSNEMRWPKNRHGVEYKIDYDWVAAAQRRANEEQARANDDSA